MAQIKVLLVDDERDFATALSERLRLRDYDARAVFDINGAFAAMTDAHPDVVLLDLRMPGMDALQIFKRIKEHSPEVEVIIVSGQLASSSADLELKGLAFDYIVKPVEIDEVTKRIKQAYSQRLNNIQRNQTLNGQ
ncbi:MAG: response regulator [Nitrospirae bacterium]|nr:response regulator [Nitrospirota bacterium]MBF0591337.1 response regulator [Nitrospirota bacterium]